MGPASGQWFNGPQNLDMRGLVVLPPPAYYTGLASPRRRPPPPGHYHPAAMASPLKATVETDPDRCCRNPLPPSHALRVGRASQNLVEVLAMVVLVQLLTSYACFSFSCASAVFGNLLPPTVFNCLTLCSSVFRPGPTQNLP